MDNTDDPEETVTELETGETEIDINDENDNASKGKNNEAPADDTDNTDKIGGGDSADDDLTANTEQSDPKEEIKDAKDTKDTKGSDTKRETENKRPREPFKPLYTVSVKDASKDGEFINFIIKTIVEATDKSYNVTRQYEDIAWLHHGLVIADGSMGLIIPPVLSKPIIEPKSVESKSRKQFGKDSAVLVADNFYRECRQVEKFLKLVINHTGLGKDPILENFLTEKDAPTRAKVKKGLVSRLSSTIEGRKEKHKDIDDLFRKERDWLHTYFSAMKETSSNFSKLVNCHSRMTSLYAHLSSTLKSGDNYEDDAATKLNKFFTKFSEALDDAKHGLEVDSNNDEQTLGFQLDLYTKYLEAEKEMLFRRTCLLIEFEDTSKTLDKAKPQKRLAAEELKKSAEKAYEDCTDLARVEIKTFHRQRLLAMQQGMTSYAEAKIKTARDTYALLAKTLTVLKQFDMEIQ